VSYRCERKDPASTGKPEGGDPHGAGRHHAECTWGVMVGRDGKTHRRTGGTAHRPFPTSGMRVVDTDIWWRMWVCVRRKWVHVWPSRWVQPHTSGRRGRPVWRPAPAFRCATGPMGGTARGRLRRPPLTDGNRHRAEYTTRAGRVERRYPAGHVGESPTNALQAATAASNRRRASPRPG
jgi:hypothetical protein